MKTYEFEDDDDDSVRKLSSSDLNFTLYQQQALHNVGLNIYKNKTKQTVYKRNIQED